jgi:rhamnulose-1-phosphate aldolase
MNKKFQSIIDRVADAANDIWLRGWAEANAGNISVRLDKSMLPHKNFCLSSKWQTIGHKFPQIAGDFFLVSAAGSFLKNFKTSPQENLGVIQIDLKGSRYKILWGFLPACCLDLPAAPTRVGRRWGRRRETQRQAGSPTSELLTHLYIHSVRKKISKGTDKVVIHTHCPFLSALCFILSLDTVGLTQLLWRMHPECIISFPEGVCFIPWLLPGSLELAKNTAEACKSFRACIWQFHGIVAAGPDPDKTVGLIDTIEKACEIYIKAVSAGGIKNRLTKEQLVKIAGHFHLKPNKEILSQIE